MAQTFLNLAQGVTGTLPNANFSGGKIGQLVTANIGGSDVTTTSTSYSDLATINITPSATSSSILPTATMGMVNSFLAILTKSKNPPGS